MNDNTAHLSKPEDEKSELNEINGKGAEINSDIDINGGGYPALSQNIFGYRWCQQ